MQIIKKDGTKENFDKEKIIKAVNKSAERVSVVLTESELYEIVESVKNSIRFQSSVDTTVLDIHRFVESALDKVNSSVAKSYRDYRNYKTNFVSMLDEVYTKAQSIMYIGDRDNANSDSTLISTQQSLIRGELTKVIYDRFYMNEEERQACKDGYIYIHDKKDRIFSTNCCIFDIKTVLEGGFHSCNFDYTEPKTITAACAVVKNIIMMGAAQQYGGFSVRLDDVLDKYCELSYNVYKKDFNKIANIFTDPYDNFEEISHKYAVDKTLKDLEQGIQGIECDLNTLASSRGDFPFVSVGIGLNDSFWGQEVSKMFLKVRREGQGKPGFKKPVLFPKLIFLYTEKLHGRGMPLEDVFEEAIKTSSKCMYPDYVSLDAEYTGDVYKKWGQPIVPMG